MKKLFLIVSFLLSFNLNSQLIDTNPALNNFLMLLLENGILDERINSDREIAEEICKSNNKSTSWDACSTISKAICVANNKSTSWDAFYDQYGNLQWRCRSIKTGRFAENYNCRNDRRDDDRWPNK